MLKEVHVVYEPAEVLPVSQSSLAMSLLIMARFLREQALDEAAFWQFYGEHFVGAWARLKGEPATAVAHRLGQTLVAAGGVLESFFGDDTHAEVSVSNVMPHPFRIMTQTTQNDIKLILKLFIPILESLDFQYEWQIQNERVTITIWRG